MFKKFDFKTAIKFNRYIVVGLIIIAMIFAITAIEKTEINKTLVGVKIQFGNETMASEIRFEIEGTMNKSLVSGEVFSGNLLMNQETYKFFRSKGDSKNSVTVNKIVDGVTTTFGKLYYDEDVTKFVLLLNGWNENDGLMIVAPSANRSEALQLMEEILKDGEF